MKIYCPYLIIKCQRGTNGSQILPTSDRQARPLVSLEPEQQRLAWQQAVKLAGGKIPSGRIAQDIVDKILCFIGQYPEKFLISTPNEVVIRKNSV
ncbi:hypothetical protein IQ259_14730 [Fortiea sp. LEGE XX443]|uniref:hypothetical protein n=1 Tax=Fortiea sp. LEGE XX443 TaxID=1828611 RepID=UPI00187FE054|nr:hypothetical protein [Fortiea sp. LEGE XX443]MBE9006277.1 hypothetical protein [Fortiea sp. LEGE XX443]